MPILKKYAASTPKNGYYVHAPVAALDHPIPLQTSATTVEIYRHLGYDPDAAGNDGVSVPNKLTWKLYDVGLHWTESSISAEPSDTSEEADLDENGPPLTTADVDAIRDLVDEHHGETKEQLESLVEELGSEIDASDDSFDPTFDRTYEQEKPLWEMAKSCRREISDDLEEDLKHRINEGAVVMWSVDIEISEFQPENDPEKVTVSVDIKHLVKQEEQYHHTLYVCAEHGLERSLSLLNAEPSWTTRLRIENQVAAIKKALMEASTEFGFPLGHPFSRMEMKIINDPEMFSEDR